jgi:alkanesulfonate monooxygenase SsuD/methylene tetrahydromethanopterin reductase-like flavin-dependent oxidoreductase (luciferase family)
MTHGDADENDDVLACASTAAIAEHGQASRAIWILGASGRAGRVIAAELGVAARLARGERADRAPSRQVRSYRTGARHGGGRRVRSRIRGRRRGDRMGRLLPVLALFGRDKPS